MDRPERAALVLRGTQGLQERLPIRDPRAQLDPLARPALEVRQVLKALHRGQDPLETQGRKAIRVLKAQRDLLARLINGRFIPH